MTDQNQIYRIDSFVVPDAAMPEFLEKVKETHQMLAQQSGFIRDGIYQQVSGPGRMNLITLVCWKDEASILSARTVVKSHQAKEGFDPAAVMKRLGIEANIAQYEEVPH